jgi:hypothetical protein
VLQCQLESLEVQTQPKHFGNGGDFTEHLQSYISWKCLKCFRMDSELVLKVVLDNLLTPDSRLISRIACCSKECNQLARDYMDTLNTLGYLRTLGSGRKLLQTHLRTKTRCALCNQTLTNLCNPLSIKNPTCEDCTSQRFIYTTDAKRQYRMTPGELAKLDCIVTYHKTYHTELRQYTLHIVKSYSYLKHKGLPPPYTHHTDSQIRKRRQNQLDEMLSTSIPLEDQVTLRNWEVCKTFIKSGNRGVRDMRRILSAYKPLKEALRPLNASHIEPLQFLVSYADNPLATMQGIQERLASDHRREELQKALAIHSLKLRNDSNVCAKYIQDGVGDLESIVKLMRQMDYFYKQSNYPKIYRRLLSEAYHTAKTDIYNEYGWIENLYYFEELLEERIDRPHLSRIAKAMVIKSLPDDKIPEFLLPQI